MDQSRLIALTMATLRQIDRDAANWFLRDGPAVRPTDQPIQASGRPSRVDRAWTEARSLARRVTFQTRRRSNASAPSR